MAGRAKTKPASWRRRLSVMRRALMTRTGGVAVMLVMASLLKSSRPLRLTPDGTGTTS